MSAIARENYVFLQSHPKQHFQLSDDGRLTVIDAVASSAMQSAVAAACFRAKVWGHLIPEVRELRGRGVSPKAVSLLAEVKALRKENPFSNPRFKELLNELEAALKELSPPKQGIEKKWVILGAAPLVLATLAWNNSALFELEEETLFLTTQIGQVALLFFAMLSERMAMRAGGMGKKILWRIGVGVGFVGCLAPFIKEDPASKYFL